MGPFNLNPKDCNETALLWSEKKRTRGSGSSGGQKRPHEETTTSKLIQPGSNADYHSQIEQGQDASRFGKVPRIENRDEKRPTPPSSLMQKSSSTFSPLSDHPKSSCEVLDPSQPVKAESGATKVEETETKGHVRVSGMSSWGFTTNPSSDESVPVTEENVNTDLKPVRKDLSKKEGGSELQGGPQERKKERDTDPSERQRSRVEEGVSSSPAQAQMPATEPEKEKEGGFAGVQQRRRHVRTRASPNSAAHRELRFRPSRLREDVVQGESSSSFEVMSSS